jgi:hypothetical protein
MFTQKPWLKKPMIKKPIAHIISPISNNIDKILPYQHFIIIRFSLAFSQGNLQNMNYTLDESRLEKRFKLFENICLPSLINQIKKDNVYVIINITNNLPEKWKNRLKELINNHSFIQIQEFDHTINETLRTCLHNKFLEKYTNSDTKLIATSRFDDDDALTPNFTDIVSKFMTTRYINHILSLSSGYYYNPITKKCSTVNVKLLAIGLTLIQAVNQYEKFPYGIYSREHTIWNKITKCIYLNNVKYLRTVHDTNNSIKNGVATRVPSNNQINNLSILRKTFPGIIL